MSGAEPVSPQLAKWVDEELQVEFNQGFGQTEANYFIGTCSAVEKARLEPLGKPYPGHDVSIVSPEGVPLKTGESGEIAIRRDSPVVMREYWKNPAAMSDKFKEGWCMTGDLGHMDDEGLRLFPGPQRRRHQEFRVSNRSFRNRSQDHGAQVGRIVRRDRCA